MKNFAIHNMINSKSVLVNLHGFLPKEGFKMLHLKNKLPNRPLEIIENRITMLETAEKLALADKDPKNFDENMNMIFRCTSGKIELMNVRQLLTVAS